jgi:signal transduction histidine kinase
MESSKRKLLEETYRLFMDAGFSKISPDILEDISDDHIMGFGTTLDEKIFKVSGLRELLERQKKQSEGISMHWDIKPLHRHISADENMAIYADDLLLHISAGSDNLEMYMRFSIVLEYKNEKWVVVHWHGSKPKDVESEKDTWGIETWKQKAEELERLVAEKTTDLLEKNRELEIEAALERVRSRSMAMKDSSDLSDVVFSMFTELVKLDAQLDRCLILIVNPETNAITWYLTGKEGLLSNNGFLVTDNDHPSHKAYLDGWRKKRKKWNYLLAGEEKRNWDAYGFSETELSQLPDFIKADMAAIEAIHLTISSDDFGCLIASSLSPLSDVHAGIVERFTVVFNQTYSRFLDLKKAEAQKREAQVEAALERVRSRSMAMHKSEELKEVIRVVLEQFVQLNMNVGHAGFYIDYKAHDDMHIWLADPNIEPFFAILPYFDTPTWNSFLEAKAKGITLHTDLLDFETKNQFYSSLFELFTVPEEAKKFYLACKGLAVSTVLLDTVGLYIENFDAFSYTDEENNILIRFGKVFQQTYTRFLDLQKAEAQAREAQIEAALERVRSSAMAMRTSDELSGLIGKVFTECTKLNIHLDRGIIMIFDPGTLDSRWWMANPEAPELPNSYHVPFNQFAPYLAYISGWKDRTVKWTYVLEGKEKRDWDAHIFVKSELNRLPAEVKEVMMGFTKVYLNASFNNFGTITLATLEPMTQDDFDILLRFAKVFDLTYTRFNDLKQAEAQAREARIEAALERVRSRTMGMQKSSELNEVAFVLFEQIRLLGGRLWGTGFALCDVPEGQDEFWFANEMGVVPPVNIPNAEDEVHKAMLEGWKQNNEYLLNEKGGDALAAHYKYLYSLPQMKAFFDPMLAAGFTFPTWQQWHAAYFSKGYLLIITTEPYAESDIFRRFAKVFDQTYTRFLDLQKSEEQAREAHIEAALERVRSKTMAMHNSNDVGESVAALFDELVNLGVLDKNDRCGIGIMHPDEKMELWTAEKTTGKTDLTIGYLDMRQHQLLKNVYQGWLDKRDTYQYILEGEDKLQYYEAIRNQSEYKIRKDYYSVHERIVHTDFYFKEGCMYVFSLNEFSTEATSIFIRFANVFGQTYRRYLDLQKAEAQAREAQIQLGLERVRAKTMAMQNQHDLFDVVNAFGEQLVALGLKVDYVSFINGTISKDRDWDLWGCNPNLKLPAENNIIPYKKTAYFTKTAESVENFERTGNPIQVKLFTKDEKDDFFDHYFSYAAPVQEEFKQYLYDAPGSIIVDAFLSEVTVSLCRYDLEPFTEEQLDIFNRFSKEFRQAYIRFLDLKKAEAQAKEAQIEAALERVRSKTMAMHNSRDVGESVASLFDELNALGALTAQDRCGIGIMQPNEIMELWTAEKATGKTELTIGQLDMSTHILHKNVYQSWLDKKETYQYILEGEDKLNYYEAMRNQANYKIRKDYYSTMDRIVHTDFFFKEGCLYVFSQLEFTTEVKSIFSRFVNVFGQTYRRYLDLQRAEAQAREAQIEASLERVRGKALAMHSSQDLADTIGVFYRELQAFSLTPRRCGVGLLNKETRVGEILTWNTTEEGASLELVGRITMQGHPVLENVYNGWLSQTDYYPVLRGNEIKEYYSIIRPMMAFPDYRHDEVQYGYFFFFNEGGVYAWTDKEMNDDEIQIYRRFTSVLSLTYSRYKDLKEAEVRAAEAVKQAALDRVRAEISSMRTAEDLQRITPLMWHELTTLGVPFFRCGVFIIKEQEQLVHAYLTTPDGKSLAVLHLPFEGQGTTYNTVEHWRRQTVYTEHWDKERFKEWTQSMVEQGQIAAEQQYQAGQAPPESLCLQFIPFTQGMLYIGSADPLDAGQIELAHALANAFAVAYARYEDFIQLETAKQQIEKTLVDLRQTQAQLVQSEKMASLGELTAGIAHEIQNPLNFVNNFSEVSNELISELVEEVDKGNTEEVKAIAKDVMENLEKIHHHGERASSIVRGMLQHSRSSTGAKEPTDINALIDEYVRLAYHGLKAKDKSFNATYITDFDPDIPPVPIIPQDMGRVLLNLINNAFYAVHEKKKTIKEGYKPEVIVSSEVKGDYIVLSVSDNGNGIPEAIRGKIFQPFFTTKPTGEGTGLGLSLSYDIVKAHNGELKVKTKDGEGSQFIIQLPVS